MTQSKNKRTVTIELTNRQWFFLACALSVGLAQMPSADERDAKTIYLTVFDAVFPE